MVWLHFKGKKIWFKFSENCFKCYKKRFEASNTWGDKNLLKNARHKGGSNPGPHGLLECAIFQILNGTLPYLLKHFLILILVLSYGG